MSGRLPSAIWSIESQQDGVLNQDEIIHYGISTASLGFNLCMGNFLDH